MWSPRHGSPARLRALAPRALAALGCVAALGCASYSEPAADSEQWTESVREVAGQAAQVTARGARATGAAVATAYRGVRDGFAEPDPKGYGPFPREYARRIRHHLVHLEGVSPKASFQLGTPEKGYVNAGILAGGHVTWQGWLVEVAIRKPALFGREAPPDRFVVRMRDGEVFEVVEAEYADGLRWADRRDDVGEADPGVAANME